MNVTQIAARALLAASLAGAAIGLTQGTAQAQPASQHVWCPGDSMDWPSGPGADKVWDWNVCHTWWFVKGGFGNVALRDGGVSGNVFEGEFPPPGGEYDCGRDLFGFPNRC